MALRATASPCRLGSLEASAYANNIGTLARTHKWREAVATLPEMLQNSVPPDMVVMCAVMTACQQAMEWQQVLRAVGGARLEPSSLAYSMAVGACARARCWEALTRGGQLQRLLLLEPDMRRPSTSYWLCGGRAVRRTRSAAVACRSTPAWGSSGRRRLRSLVGCRRAEGGSGKPRGDYGAATSKQGEAAALAEELLAAKPTRAARDGTELIVRLGRDRKWQEALNVLFSMLSSRIALGVITYGAALGACERSGQWQPALALLAGMRLMGPVPNVITTNAVISACARAQRWEWALHLLCSMGESELVPDVVSFNAAINACEKGRRLDEALALLREMGPQQVKPDVISFSSALSACEKAYEWELALQLLQEMHQRSLKADLVAFNAAMSACAKDGCWQLVLELLATAKEEALHPDKWTFGAAISACEKGVNWERALSLLAEMAEEALQPDVVACSAAISACEKGMQDAKAVAVLLQMRTWAVLPNVVTCSAVLGAYEKTKQWEEALGMLDSMRRQGLEPNALTHNVVLVALANLGEWGAALSHLTSSSRVEEPSIVLVNTGIRACAKAAHWAGSLALLPAPLAQAPAEGGCQPRASSASVPDSISYNAAISACVRAGVWLLCAHLLEETWANRQPAHTVAYQHAAQACGHDGSWVAAGRVLELMREHGLAAATGTLQDVAMWALEAGQAPAPLGPAYEPMPPEQVLVGRLRVHAKPDGLEAALRALQACV